MVAGFVQQQHVRLLTQHLRQQHPLAFAAGERQDILTPLVLQLHGLERALHRFRAAVVRLQKPPMRVSPHRDDFFHRVGVGKVAQLAQHCHPARKRARLHAAQVGAVQRYQPGVGEFLADGAQQGGFPRAIRAANHQPLPVGHGKGHVMHNFGAPAKDGNMLGGQVHARSLLFVRRKMTRNAAAPMMDVTTPTGSTAGARIVREIRSARSRKIAPP